MTFWGRETGLATRYAGQSGGCAGLTPCVAGGRRTSSPKRGYQSSRHLGIGQSLEGCKSTTSLVVEFCAILLPASIVVVSSLLVRFPICLSNISAGERRERVTKCAQHHLGNLRGPPSRADKRAQVWRRKRKNSRHSESSGGSPRFPFNLLHRSGLEEKIPLKPAPIRESASFAPN